MIDAGSLRYFLRICQVFLARSRLMPLFSIPVLKSKLPGIHAEKKCVPTKINKQIKNLFSRIYLKKCYFISILVATLLLFRIKTAQRI